MATTAPRPSAVSTAAETVYVDRFCDGIIGPGAEVLGTVRDGGHIVANTAPGCWGPMITPAIKGGHEVTLPVAVEGAEVGDAIAIRIRSIDVTSIATASGNDRTIEGRFNGDPYCAKVCARCGAEDEATVVEGIGPDCVRCAACGAPASPFAFTNGYTMAFDEARQLGITVGRAQAEAFAHDAAHVAALPASSVQNPIVLFAPSDLVGVVARMRPFMGQLGTMPAVDLPDSHNAGDFGAFLLGAPHSRAVTAEQLAAAHRRPPRHRRRPRRGDPRLPGQAARRRRVPRRHARDAGRRRDRRPHHRRVRDGHAAGVGGQGPGDRRPDPVPGRRGPPVPRPPADRAGARGGRGAGRAPRRRPRRGRLPVSFVGTGPDLNSAVDNGLGRAASVLGMEVPEVMNRATISGAIEIGRAPGVVQVTLRAPVQALAARGLDGLAREQYGAAA